MPAPTLNGHIEFMPLVGIAAGLHKKKGDENDISFNRGCPKCHGAVKQKIVCEACGLPDIKTTECVKLYKEKDQPTVVFTEDELKTIKGSKEKKMSFVAEAYIPASELDPLWIKEAYEITPGTHDGQTYAYIRAAMKRKQLACVGTMVLYGKKRACAIMPRGDWLMFYSLEFADTVRSSDSLCADAKAWVPTDDTLVPEAIDGAVAKLEEMPAQADYQHRLNEREANVLQAIEDRRKDPNASVVPLTLEVPAQTANDAVSFFLAAARKREAA